MLKKVHHIVVDSAAKNECVQLKAKEKGKLVGPKRCGNYSKTDIGSDILALP